MKVNNTHTKKLFSAAVRNASLAATMMVAISASAAYADDKAKADAPEAKKGFWERDQMLGDMGGVRPELDKYGISLAITETSEVLGNTTGGKKRGFEYDGATSVSFQMDMQRAFDLKGGTFNVSALDLHGTDLSSRNLDTLQTASGIEAHNSFRLFELWYQQAFADGKADVRVGQQSLDQEFMISQGALLFVNTMFGWPMIPSADMISGGPAYPLSAPAARLKVQVTDQLTWLAAVFNDNPAGLDPRSTEDAQIVNNHGLNLRTSDNALVITEVQYSRVPAGDEKSTTLPGTYRLGAWFDFADYADQRYGTDGLTLTAGNGIARLHHGNYSLYAVADQTVWKDGKSPEALSLFLRAMGAPKDQNQIDFSLNAGLNYRALFEGRDDDTFGLGLGYTHVSTRAKGNDIDSGAIGRTHETFVEVTYQYSVAPWWILQPDFQYTFNPGGGVTNANVPGSTKRIGNEAVMGVRTNLTF